LYIGAILESDFETQAHFTERNSPIFQKDSDFEVFVDPFGSCHNYKELEVNAINTVWNLMLDKPYNDGGIEHSGRIAKPGEDQYYEVHHQKTATQLLKGKLNDPNDSAIWSVEVALSYKDLLAHTTQSSFEPMIGSMMRINFSRVERQGDINWTWQPQIVWDPARRRYSGYVAMHLPDAWGYFVFGGGPHDNDGDSPQRIIPKDTTWPARLAAMNVYYAQVLYQQQQQGKGTYASSLAQLTELVDDAIVGPFQIQFELSSDGESYVATVTGNPDGCAVTVTQDRLLQVIRPNGADVSTD
jgi:hypothetical protein